MTKKARAQVKDDKAQVGIGAGLHGQDGNGREHGDAEHDKSHVAALGEIKDDAGGIGCSRSSGEFGAILECQRKGVVRCGA